jgi:hypothetical protein
METPKTERDGERKASRECQPLIQSSHINIYRENTFRITGLPVDASEKEFKKHADKLKMMEELGYGQGANPAAFALDPPPSVDQIREAMQRLKEPEHRLVDEFFWFWPQEFGKSSHDPAIQAILSGDSGTAYDIWTRLETSPDHDYIACHNIAVMFHLIALDWTLYHISSEVDEEREGKIKGYWKKSFGRWEKIATDDRVWDALKARIRVLDDPRLTTGFARRMRDTFPEALDKINAEAALRFAEQGRTDWAKIHIDFMNETHQGLDDVQKTAELVLTPTRNRVLQHIKTAKEECAKKPENGADAARKLIEQCSPLQSLFELFHGSDSHHKTEIFDDVAVTVINCVVAYQKKTADNEAFVTLLKESLQFATGMDVRQRIQKYIDIGEGNIRGKALDPIYAELKKIQESKAKAEARLIQVKQQMMPRLLTLAETEGDQKSLVAELSDSIAVVLRGISIDAYNKEKNNSVASDAILLASKLVHDPELKKRIKDDLLVIREGMGTATCFFCDSEPGHPKRKIGIKMHRITEQTATGVRYNTNTISVPRCNNCYGSHNKHWNFMWWGAIAGAIVGAFLAPWAATGGIALAVLIGGGWLALLLFGAEPRLGCFGVVGLLFAAGACLQLAENELGQFISLNMLGGAVIGGFITFWIAKKSIHKETPEGLAVGYRRIVALAKEGWKFGEKPAGYS